MIREICKDEAFLAQKAEPATPDDLSVAADLLETLAQDLREQGKTAVPTCPYAVKWFDKHPDQADLLWAEKGAEA